jgi:uncharacterized membrane-anchored protein
MSGRSLVTSLTLFLAVIAAPVLSFAEDAAPAQPDPQAIWESAMKVWKSGPADVTLEDQAVLHVPSEMAFIPKSESNALLVAWGNSADDRLLGMVVPKSTDQNWVTTIDKTLEGYVKDDEAKNWNSDELLQTLKDGTEAQNKDREERGFAPLDVVGWIEKPNYEAPSHRLVWSMKMVHRGVEHDDNAVVNYNTYALGRDGYLEVDLLTNEQGVEREKPFAKEVLAALQYNQGKRYEDYKPGTDHLAEYGIAALVGGVVAKKLGLLALASVFILKFIKVIAVAAVVGLGGIKKFFFGKKSDNA